MSDVEQSYKFVFTSFSCFSNDEISFLRCFIVFFFNSICKVTSRLIGAASDAHFFFSS